MTTPTIPTTPASHTETQNGHRSPALLSFDGGEVVIPPKHYDLLLMCAEKATEMYRNAIKRDERVSRFQTDLLVPLHGWCVARKEKILACYLPIPGVHVQVFIVTKSKKFDFDLAVEMAALELGLARAKGGTCGQSFKLHTGRNP